MPDYDSYIICTTPRSGSTMLCALLEQSKVAGAPQSYFHQPSLTKWCAGLGLPSDTHPRKIMACARKLGMAGSNISGIRMQRHSFGFWAEQLKTLFPSNTTDAERIARAFGRTRFLFLTRLDKVAQAVSLVRADQSGLWHRNADGSERERLAAAKPPQYDETKIATELSNLVAQDMAWKTWFAAENIDPLYISYDALSANPCAVVGEILGDLGLDMKAALNLRPATMQLSDDTNKEWIARFSASGV
ncbi:Stf0 family sulfotransferase [Ascidiaceihabitans sp.]|uniref:Stf0 family sulfotransferase n=1 Tax=Ascidiaceihabitans sp. TaxID=1872644 RepID=UPI0032985FF4